MSTGNNFSSDFDRGTGPGDSQSLPRRDAAEWAPSFGDHAESRVTSDRGRRVGSSPRWSVGNIISAVTSLLFLLMIGWFMFGDGLSSGIGMFPIFFGVFVLIAVLNIVRKFLRR